MKPSHHLFQLIQTMSRSEKRYFKLYANRSGLENDHNYLILFQAIDKMHVYNEAQLIKGLNSPKLKRQLPVLKNYLYNLILKSLREFKTNQTINFQIKEVLTNVELLIKRNLVDQAKKQLEKASRLVLEFERYEYTPELSFYQIEISLQLQNEKLEKSINQVDDLFIQVNHSQDHLATFNTLRSLSWKLMLLNRTATYARSPKVKAAYLEINQHPILQSPPPLTSIRSSLLYYQCKGIIHLSFREFRASLDQFISLDELMEENPWSILQSPALYIHNLQNRIQVAKQILSPDQYFPLLEKLKQFPERFPKAKTHTGFQLIAQLFDLRIRLEASIGQGELEAAHDLVFELKQLLQEEEKEININAGYSILEVYSCLAHFHIEVQDWAVGLNYLNLILSQKIVNKEQEIYLDAQLLRVIVLFELHEMDLFETGMENLHRFLKDRERLFAFEKAIFEYLRKRMRLAPEESVEPWFRKLQADMIAIADDPNEQLGLYPFDIVAWIEKTLESGRV